MKDAWMLDKKFENKIPYFMLSSCLRKEFKGRVRVWCCDLILTSRLVETLFPNTQQGISPTKDENIDNIRDYHFPREYLFFYE